MFVRIMLIGATLVVLMVVAHDRHWGQRLGLTGTCWAIQPPLGQPPGPWYACKQGILTSYPSLESDSCTSTGIVAHDELWKCLTPVTSFPGY